MPVSVQRKEESEAQELYQSILNAMKALDPAPRLIELTCDKDEDKKVAVLSDQISAVILNKKSGAAAGGRVPGFFSTQNAE